MRLQLIELGLRRQRQRHRRWKRRLLPTRGRDTHGTACCPHYLLPRHFLDHPRGARLGNGDHVRGHRRAGVGAVGGSRLRGDCARSRHHAFQPPQPVVHAEPRLAAVLLHVTHDVARQPRIDDERPGAEARAGAVHAAQRARAAAQHPAEHAAAETDQRTRDAAGAAGQAAEARVLREAVIFMHGRRCDLVR